jgi:hypothetical protein
MKIRRHFGLKIALSLEIFLLITMVACSRNGWYELTKRYVEVDEALLKASITKSGNWRSLDEKRQNLALQIGEVTGPSLHEIEGYLGAGNTEKKKIVSAFLMLKKIQSHQIVDEVVNAYNTRDDFMTRFYMINYMDSLGLDLQKEFEDQIVRILFTERNGAIIIASMPLVSNLPYEKAIYMFAHFFEMNDYGVDKVSYINLIKLGDNAVADVKDLLEKRSKLEALASIRKIEKKVKKRGQATLIK